MDGVDPEKARPPLRVGLAAHTDLYCDGAHLGEPSTAVFVSAGLAQVVEMPIGDARQALIAAVSEQTIGALTQLARSRA